MCSSDLEISQSRIDHAGARGVETAGAFLQHADQFVAVGWLFGQEREQHELQFA